MPRPARDEHTPATFERHEGVCACFLWQVHHVVIIADAGPLIVMFLVDGVFCDGGGIVSAGWSWIPPFKKLGRAEHARIAPQYGGQLREGKLYDRSLRVSEGVSSYRAQRQEQHGGGPD